MNIQNSRFKIEARIGGPPEAKQAQATCSCFAPHNEQLLPRDPPRLATFAFGGATDTPDATSSSSLEPSSPLERRPFVRLAFERPAFAPPPRPLPPRPIAEGHEARNDASQLLGPWRRRPRGSSQNNIEQRAWPFRHWMSQNAWRMVLSLLPARHTRTTTGAQCILSSQSHTST